MKVIDEKDELLFNDEKTWSEPNFQRHLFARHLSRRLPPPSPSRWMFMMCANDHPNISLNPEVLGGIPHIKNTRLSVGQLLGRVYALGSIMAVANYYSEINLTEDLVKEAVSFAQDFVECAGDPYQIHD
jgi:uncharacterized protein (DUF433 family)